MKNDSHDIELIERYFDNELSEPESQALLNRLKEDQQLNKLFEQEKLLISAIRFKAISNNLQYLKQVEGSVGKGIKKDSQKAWFPYAIAACIILLIVASVSLWPGRQDTGDLYADYFEPFPNVFQPTLRTQNVVNLRTEAFSAYEEGNYLRASELFTKVVQENPDPGVLMLLGNANLMIEKPKLAEQNFNDLIDQYDELDVPAKWFLSLTYLKMRETEKARSVLTEVVRAESPYASKAKALLTHLE
jgi:tetratricopeptide (TPR) repeat protein